MFQLFSQISGGPTYYLRALKYSARWHNYFTWLDRHFLYWPSDYKELVLVGPSGGWALPPAFLKKFSKVIAYDIDPFARAIFQSRNGLENMEWRREDFFGGPDGSKLPQYSFESSHILFCNVLGQIGLVYGSSWKRKPQLEEVFAARLREFFRSQPYWASFHDVYSLEHSAPLQECGVRFKGLEDFSQKTGFYGPYVDHLTERYFTQRHEDLCLWQLSPRNFHLIGWKASLFS